MFIERPGLVDWRSAWEPRGEAKFSSQPVSSLSSPEF